MELCRVWSGSCSFDEFFVGGGCGLGCSSITMRRCLPKRERKIKPPSPHLNQCQPKHETQASRPIYVVMSSKAGDAPLWGIWLDCGGEMYSPEYIRLYYLPSSTTHLSQPLPPKSPTPIRAALQLLVTNLYPKSCLIFTLYRFYHKFLGWVAPRKHKVTVGQP